METWTVTVTTPTGRVAYSMEVDITPEHSDAVDGVEAIMSAYNQMLGWVD
jgi:hypothetical protein